MLCASLPDPLPVLHIESNMVAVWVCMSFIDRSPYPCIKHICLGARVC